MYRFSRAIFVEIKDLVRVVPGESYFGRPDQARDPRYFAKPSQSLFSEVRHLFSISDQARVYRSIERHISKAIEYIMEELERAGEGTAQQCRATTRKGKPCQRTPLPERDYCPSHQHLEAKAAA